MRIWISSTGKRSLEVLYRDNRGGWEGLRGMGSGRLTEEGAREEASRVQMGLAVETLLVWEDRHLVPCDGATGADG